MKRRLVGLVICIAVLSGCAERAMVTGRSIKAYSLSHRDYAATHGLRAEVVGNPFRRPKSEVEAVVGDVLVDRHFGPPFRRVVTSRTEPVRSPYRVVFAFRSKDL